MEKERKERKKKREIKENIMRTNIKAIAQAKATLLCDAFSKGECIWVEFQKRHKVTYCISPHIPIIVEPRAIMEDVTS